MATATTTPTKPDDEGLLAPGQTFGSISEQVGDIVTQPVRKGWLFAAAVSFLLLQLLLMTIVNLIFIGVGIWGINMPHAWAFAIINFVWWIGIGHAGTLISAILLLLHQRWRNSINRFAEAMTIFAVLCAGMFPLFHMGRPWFFFWLLPLPNSMDLWPQWRSPLMWDVFAVSTYLTVSLLFWLSGMIPDFANLRDRAKHPALKILFGILSLGWRGSAKHWQRYESAYLILAGLSTPLVLSVHTIVSFDFAVANLPGWHATIFPPYFVAGAIYAGFAMVLTLVIPIRYFYRLENLITQKHMDFMGRLMLVTGLMVAYGYSQEAFMAWYSGEVFEQQMMWQRMFGPYGYAYWFLLLCNAMIPQLLWFRSFRLNMYRLFGICMVVSVGMWLERYVILMTLSRDFLPSSWGQYLPTQWDWAMFIGTIGFFLFGMFMFIRVIPMIAMFEVQQLLPEADPHHKPHKAHDAAHQPGSTTTGGTTGGATEHGGGH
jgi:molybdopterin-containing oxidoreductase family membrane subunit